MGDRFLLVRLDSTQGRSRAGRQAIDNSGDETAVRTELASAVSGVLSTVEVDPDCCKTSPKISAQQC
jgi:hypothetical protein